MDSFGWFYKYTYYVVGGTLCMYAFLVVYFLMSMCDSFWSCICCCGDEEEDEEEMSGVAQTDFQTTEGNQETAKGRNNRQAQMQNEKRR